MENVNSKILFFGTPAFALPALQALIDADYPIVGVVTQPDEPMGRKHILTPPPVKVLAMQKGIPVFQPERLDAGDFVDKIARADLFIVTAYGKIIPQKILDLPQRGALNIHPSLLPRWRGPSPIQAAILAGDEKTGVTIIKLDEKMDHGPMLAQREWELSKPTYPELHDQLAKLGAELLIEILPPWIVGEIAPVPQNESQATYCKLLTRQDGRIDWSKPAEEIERMIRAYHPWPGSWTIWKSPDGDRRIRIEEVDIVNDAPPAGGASGLIWQNTAYPLLIKSGQGSLAIKKLGIEGKSITDAASFLRGYPSIIGSIFW